MAADAVKRSGGGVGIATILYCKEERPLRCGIEIVIQEAKCHFFHRRFHLKCKN